MVTYDPVKMTLPPLYTLHICEYQSDVKRRIDFKNRVEKTIEVLSILNILFK